MGKGYYNVLEYSTLNFPYILPENEKISVKQYQSLLLSVK